MRKAIISGLILVTVAVPATAADAPKVSWGKPNVSMEQYRSDAVACGRQAYYLDIANTDAVKVLVAASSRIENLLENASTNQSSPEAVDPRFAAAAHEVDAAQLQARYREIKTLQTDALATCLTARGYTRFTLSPEQRHRLQKLHAGSPERHAYLQALASDPEVLTAQTLP